MRKPLWRPSEERVRQANVTKFIGFVNEACGLSIGSYDELYRWSIEDIPDFWAVMWEFGEIGASRKYTRIVDDLSKFPGAEWFSGATLNFAGNLLRYRDNRLAFIFADETGGSARITYAELYRSVSLLAQALRDEGVVPGDRVAAYTPNLIETATAMLATTSIGALWSSCGTELGAQAVIDRLGQVAPKILFTVDQYVYKGKSFDFLQNVREVVDKIPSLKRVVVIPCAKERPNVAWVPKCILYEDFVSKKQAGEVRFEQLPFSHPVYIMFSSGTTGKPKSIVQGAGGVLINHLKELMLHTDLKRQDIIFYIATPSWMMWNWLLSSLAVGATILLYDGSPNHPDWRTIWNLIQEERVTIFGCSASYINFLRSVDAKPGREYDLSTLREISQTGSPLSVEGFEYVYRGIKKDIHFNSISGGTDINGCFAAGTPIQPVYAGELQSPALAMKVKAYDAEGRSVVDQQGELVCEAPTPSMPLRFWSDPEGKKYRDAYFTVYRSVWRHGDWVIIHGDTGGITFLGRSDFTLKPLGVRIGPAEIYNVVEKLEEVADSIAVEQDWKGDQRIILFIKPTSGFRLTEEVRAKIRKTLREQASPRHVPALIFEVPDIPYTFNMKKVESIVSNIINGKPVTNKDALVNTESLKFYEDIASELHRE